MSEAPTFPLVDFPENVVSELEISLSDIQQVGNVFRRPLKPTDPSNSIGIYATLWMPQEYQIGQYDPAVTRYSIVVQSFVKNGSEEEGIAQHSRLAKRIKIMLYRDDALRLRLAGLSTTEGGVTERTLRWGVQNQRYLSNEIQNTFLFLATTEMWIETEVI
jgi:hypothetical protein